MLEIFWKCYVNILIILCDANYFICHSFPICAKCCIHCYSRFINSEGKIEMVMVTSQQISTDCAHLVIAARSKSKELSSSSLLENLKVAETAVTKAKDEILRVFRDIDISASTIEMDNNKYSTWKANLERKNKILVLENEIREREMDFVPTPFHMGHITTQ